MRLLLGAVMMLGMAPLAALASDAPAIVLDETDEVLELRAVLGQPETFKRSVRVRLDNSFGARFTFLPTDLKQKDGPAVIDRSNIILAGEHALQTNAPMDFELRIANVTSPGVYEGALEFLLENQVERMTPRPFRLTVLAHPALQLSDVERVRARRVQKGFCLLGDSVCPGAWLAEHLLPAELHRDALVFTVKNPSPVPATPTAMQLHLTGEHTSYVLTDKEIHADGALPTVAPHESASITLNLARNSIPPEHYLGRIRLQLDGQAQAMDLPVEISMRAAPTLAIMLMLLGIALGRLIKSMHDRGNAVNLALTEIRRMQQRVGRAPRDAQDALLRRLDALRGQVSRQHLDGFHAELDAIEEALHAAAMPNTSAAIPEGAAAHAPRGRGGFARMLGRLLGTVGRFDDGEGGPALARSMLYLLTLGGMLAVGLHAFYVVGGESFGAHPLADHLTLFLWGLTADVVSRVLSSLRPWRA